MYFSLGLANTSSKYFYYLYIQLYLVFWPCILKAIVFCPLFYVLCILCFVWYSLDRTKQLCWSMVCSLVGILENILILRTFFAWEIVQSGLWTQQTVKDQEEPLQYVILILLAAFWVNNLSSNVSLDLLCRSSHIAFILNLCA